MIKLFVTTREGVFIQEGDSEVSCLRSIAEGYSLDTQLDLLDQGIDPLSLTKANWLRYIDQGNLLEWNTYILSIVSLSSGEVLYISNFLS